MSKNRTIDGSGNNHQHPEWGKAEEPLLRLTTPAYEGRNGPSGSNRPKPKNISDIVCTQAGPVENDRDLSDYMWAWGQFLDHELDLSPDDTGERFDIPVSRGKPVHFVRSRYHPATGTAVGNPRQQVNVLSAYVDGANVYGTDLPRAAVLRTFDGTGKLKVGKDNLLPKNPGGLPNASPPGQDPKDFFIAGDIRVNEHSVLTCMHTLFVREHNRICDDLATDGRFKNATDEAIYQHARKIVGGIMQAITYNEFIPALLGKDALTPYTGYNRHVNATICNVFATAAYRLGHSMLSPEVQLAGPEGEPLGSLPFRDLFFKPKIVEKRGIDVFLAGLATQKMQQIDTKAVDAIRKFLFGNGDLAALNIQRGRDHGLPSYNQCREDYGLLRRNSFEEISEDTDTQDRLRDAYGSVDLIDPWIGGLAEDHHNDAAVGEFFFHVLKDQFERLRDGDRFWYENDPALSDREQKQIGKTELSEVIKRNTGITNIHKFVFHVPKSKRK